MSSGDARRNQETIFFNVEQGEILTQRPTKRLREDAFNSYI